MRTIYIGFSTSSLIGARLISWFLKRPFSHTYMKFQEPWFSDCTINQSTGHGVSYMSATRFADNNIIVREYPLQISDALFMQIVEFCHQNAGIDYGYLTNLGILVCRCLAKIGVHIKQNPLHSGINCSGWMYYILEEVYGKWTDEDPNLIAPDDIDNFLQSKIKV